MDSVSSSKIAVGLVIAVVLVAAAIVYYNPESINQLFPQNLGSLSKDIKTNPNFPNIPVPPADVIPNTTLIAGGGGGAGGSGSVGSQQSGGTPAGPTINLEIFGICAGSVVNEAYPFDDEPELCLQQNPPYYVILNKNATQILSTVFYDESGFNATYDISLGSVQVFNVYIQDLASLGETQGLGDEIKFAGDVGDYFSTSSFTKTDLGNKIIAAAPIFVDSNIPVTTDWKRLELYFNTPQGYYFIGNLWVYVIES
ncbi:MAG TPA: hypothetical protein VJH34_03805 [archaeon]|nr:hypothetical protein [archaeon]